MNDTFIIVTGKSKGAKIRIRVGAITKYCETDGGTGFYTASDNLHPYTLARETPEQVDMLISEAMSHNKHFTIQP